MRRLRLPTAVSLLARLLACVLAFVPDGAAAQALQGRVFDGYTGQAVARAEIAVLGDGGEPVGLALSDSLGAFRIGLASAGSYRVLAVAPGYDSLTVDSVRIDPDHVVTVELRLGPRPLEVEGLTVVARRRVGPPALQDFYDRLERHEKTGRGVVLDREILDRHVAQTGARALARESMAVREYAAYGGGRIEVRRRGARFDGTPWCEPALFLDGLPVDAGTIRSIPASALAGVELYRGAQEVPVQFMWADAALGCGVILAWTRRDGSGRPLTGGERGFQAGAYVGVGGGTDGSWTVSAVGVELERGIARSMVGWIQAGVRRSGDEWVCVPLPGASCDGEQGTPWMVLAGASLFPTGSELPLAPYVGAGLGLASPGRGIETTHLLRLGVELIPGPVHIRVEVRGDPDGWGAGVGVMF